MKRLLHLTWDSPDNPWCGGGGALRDWRILSRLCDWNPEVCTGTHPRTVAIDKECHRTSCGIGFLGEFASRGSWAFCAGSYLRRTMTKPGMVASQSVSAWAPVWASLNYPDRMLHVVHHIADTEIFERLGPLASHCHRYEQRILAEGRFFATPNKATAERILHANPSARVEVIPNGFDPPECPLPPERQGDGPVVCFFGRLDHRMKGLDRLLAAFAILSSRVPQVRLVLAGRSDRSMESWLRSALRHHPNRERVTIVPNPDDRRKYALLDGADVFCVPSRFEGWCIAAIEAQSRGLPVVATRTDGTMDSIDNGRTGILVDNDESGCAGNLAQALEHILSDEPKRKAMGESARIWASQFTWAAAAAATSDLLGEIAQTAPTIRR